MTQEIWEKVENYFVDKLALADPALESALTDTSTAGMPAIQVSPPLGKLLNLLAHTVNARKILEIGTLGGYSTIWMARALPSNGSLLSLEIDAKHAEVARANVARAGLAGQVEIRIGAALDSLQALIQQKSGPFDLIFIDADKANIPQYFEQSLKLSRPGSLIVVDNVVRSGAVADTASSDESVKGVQRLFDKLVGENRVIATAIQTVGSKGYDGVAIAWVSGG
jgi:predicted O-methyltransferase YrrM